MQVPIIHEDDHLVVIDKPSGMVVNRAESVKQATLQDWAEKELKIPLLTDNFAVKSENNDFYNRSGIVHRLDKETSGLLIIAKDPRSFILLQGQFKQRQITKKYLTMVHGIVQPGNGEIAVSVGRLPWNRERFGVLPGGRDSITCYQTLEYFQNDLDKYSYLEVMPKTGRTHQIRIHLKYLGHAVVADRFYCGRKRVRQDNKFCPRLFLHACYLTFMHPVSNKIIQVKSELPHDLQSVKDSLKSLSEKFPK